VKKGLIYVVFISMLLTSELVRDYNFQ